MRGAALKLGQLLSMLEDNIIHPIIKQSLAKARNSAYAMPKEQVKEVLSKSLGNNWESSFANFEENPFAAASIGQVHKAILKNGERVVLKIQYPGVKDSIECDLDNFKLIMNALKILPRSFYLNDIIDGIKKQFKDECDYIKEADKQEHYKAMLAKYKQYYIPKVHREFTTQNVLCQEYIEGVDVDKLTNASQEVRNWIGEQLYFICFFELFNMNFVQTDPNPGNYYIDVNRKIVYLLDFGACIPYNRQFAMDYLDLVQSAIKGDTKKVLDTAIKMKFITGEENKAALKNFTAITQAFAKLIIGHPYTDYGTQEATKVVYEKMPLLIQNRLSAIPNEIIALHRKFSGAMLQTCRLKSKVRARHIFNEIVNTL